MPWEKIVSDLWAKSSLSGWVLVVIGLFAVWQQYIRRGPAMRKLDNEEDAANAAVDATLRAEARADNDKLGERIAALEAKVETTSQTAHNLELKLISSLTAFRLIAGELQKLDPSNPVLKQAMDLIGLTSDDDLGITKGFQRIARLSGEKRP